MLHFEAARKPADLDVTPPEPSRWAAALIVAGVVASILWVTFLGWWLASALIAMI
jgi:uncharacterized membrane protein YccF (DUF307 family)